MTTPLRLCLKNGQKIYINGAVLRADRKVTLELLNHANFLLAQHFVSPAETTTPLRQLYFMVQTLLIDPHSIDSTMPMINDAILALKSVFQDAALLHGVERVQECISAGGHFEALKILRGLFKVEAEIIADVTSRGTDISQLFQPRAHETRKLTCS